jgi:ion channel POLLUX/CASTOR
VAGADHSLLADSSCLCSVVDVIIRTGVPHIQSDLKNVSAAGARAVIVLADKNTSADADAADINTVRTVLSLRGMGAPSEGHIVAEVLDVDNEPLLKIVGKNSIETFVSHDVIGRLMIQCARERGLAQVLEKLLGFDGCEFYIQEWPELTGLTYGQAMYRFEDAILVGVIQNGIEEDGPVTLLNPSNDLVINAGDRIVVIAEDDDTYHASTESLFSIAEDDLRSFSAVYRPRRSVPEKLLFVGWRRDMEDMIAELDSSVAPGSQLTLFNQLSLKKRQVLPLPLGLSLTEPQERLESGGRNNELQNMEIVNVCGNPTTRKDLERLPLEDFNSILILADQDFEHEVESHDMMHADSRSLTSLLLIRDIQNRRNVRTLQAGRISIFDPNFTEENRRTVSPACTPEDATSGSASRPGPREMVPIAEDDEEETEGSEESASVAVISEILDVRTKPLISVASVTDYVTSNELVSLSLPPPFSLPPSLRQLSMAIAMVAEQREVNNILKELLSSDGNEM